MPLINREGRFRAHVDSFGIEGSKSSGAFCLKCQLSLTYEWSETKKVWLELNGLETVTGAVWFVGKDGTRSERGIETLINALGWDKTAESLAGETQWNPADCQVVVACEEWKGKSQYRVKWFNPYDGDGQPSKRGAVKPNIQAIRDALDGPF